MEKIASFTVDHIKLQPGIYVSRKDTVGTGSDHDLRSADDKSERGACHEYSGDAHNRASWRDLFKKSSGV